MKKTAILGFGTVGSGVFSLLEQNRAVIEKNSGDGVSISKILVRRKMPECAASPLFTQDFAEIENDPGICAVMEAMGGTDPAFDYACRTLRAKKAFITSNKQLVAEKGDILHALAKENGVPFLFEAAVGGGTPLLRTIRTGLASSRIEYVYGILNATSNFILTEMANGLSFDESVKKAQKLGYAEADPTADVSGLDACRKLAIIISMLTGKKTSPDDIKTVGITGIKDTENGKVRLIARAHIGENGVNAEVSPVRLDEGDLLSVVTGDRNAVVFKGNGIRECAFFGIGAGAEATASAVLSDLCEALSENKYDGKCSWSSQKLNVLPWQDKFLQEYGG